MVRWQRLSQAVATFQLISISHFIPPFVIVALIASCLPTGTPSTLILSLFTRNSVLLRLACGFRLENIGLVWGTSKFFLLTWLGPVLKFAVDARHEA